MMLHVIHHRCSILKNLGFVFILDLPAQLPELNIIENLCSILKYRKSNNHVTPECVECRSLIRMEHNTRE